MEMQTLGRTDRHHKNILQKLVANIFTLLLAQIASKLVHFLMRSEFLNIQKNLKSATFSFENDDLSMFKDSLKSSNASNN